MKNGSFSLIGLLLGVGMIVATLGGCGGSDGPAADANPVGYYDVGTATVKMGDDTTDLGIADLQAMVNGDRIMMMSVAEGLLYDASITDITGNSFTATVTIYKDGQNLITATITGTITEGIAEGSLITGTLSGSGAGNGTFSLTYASSNNKVAVLSRIDTPGSLLWRSSIGGSTFSQEFRVDDLGNIVHVNGVNSGVFHGCNINGTISAISDTSLYSVSVALRTCTDIVVDGTYTGLAASRTQSSVDDDILVFAATNGTYSPNGDFLLD